MSLKLNIGDELSWLCPKEGYRIVKVLEVEDLRVKVISTVVRQKLPEAYYMKYTTIKKKRFAPYYLTITRGEQP